MKTLKYRLWWLAIVVPALALAGTIVRSTKLGSTTSFGTSNALGNTLAVADLDTDFNTLYSEFNGNVESANIKDGTIVGADIAAGTITNDKLSSITVSGSNITDNSVASADITDGTLATIDYADVSVTKAKLAIGASEYTSSSNKQEPVGGTNLTTLAADTALNCGALVTRGTRVLLYAAVNGKVTFGVTANVTNVITLRIVEDGVTIATATTTAANGATARNNESMPISIAIPFVYTAVAGAHTYGLRIFSSVADLTSLANLSSYYISCIEPS